eukprot:7180036-Pyramimonas_sp.AAC.1
MEPTGERVRRQNGGRASLQRVDGRQPLAIAPLAPLRPSPSAGQAHCANTCGPRCYWGWFDRGDL